MILPPARVLTEDLTKVTLREGSANLLKMVLSVLANRLQVNRQIPTVQVNEVGLKTMKLHLRSQECLLHTPVHLAPTVVQQGAVKVPMSQDRRSPIWPWMMNLLMTHTRSYLLRMPLLFFTFKGRTYKGLTGVTFYQQRSPQFKESTTMSQTMSGLAILVHLPGISLWIIKDMWPRNFTQV